MTQEEKDSLIIWFNHIKLMADKPASDDLKEVLEAISTYAEMQADYIKDNWQVENYNRQIILYGLSGT